ncbi:MAG: hypothetical protein P4L51_12260 [Puia sp.]|nr:hypothetical protein [Puia sp.]
MPNRMLSQPNPFRTRRNRRKLMTGTFSRISRVVPLIRVKRRLLYGHGSRLLDKILIRNMSIARILPGLMRSGRASFRSPFH